MEDSNENYFKELQCPFTWNISDVEPQTIRYMYNNTCITYNVMNKMFEKNKDVSEQPWINLLLSITYAYELYMNKENSRAHNELEKSIKILENEKNDDFLNKYKGAFQHVVYSVKLFFMRDKVTGSEIKEEIKRIPLYSNLSPEQKVAIIGIKANIFAEYGIEGTRHALNLAREASKKNPEEAEWSLLVGILLRRLRHNRGLDENVTDEELYCMEYAYKKNRTQNAIFLAETYSDYAKYIRFTTNLVRHGKLIYPSQRFRLNEEYNNKSYTLYREALNFNKNNKCVRIKIRCIKGLFKTVLSNVRKEKRCMMYEDLQELFCAVNQCLEAAPDNVICNQVASKMYFELKDNKNGFKYAEIAVKLGGYACLMYLIQKKLELNIKLDSEETIKALTKYSNDVYLYRTYAFAMAYYIFQEYNVSLMLKYFFMASETKMETQDFEGFSIFTKTTVDVCFLVYNEVKLTVDGKKYRNDDERKQLEKALEIFHLLYPYVENMEVQKDLKEKLQNSKKYK